MLTTVHHSGCCPVASHSYKNHDRDAGCNQKACMPTTGGSKVLLHKHGLERHTSLLKTLNLIALMCIVMFHSQLNF